MNESILNTLSENPLYNTINNPRGQAFGFHSQDHQGKNIFIKKFIKLEGE